MMLDLHPDPRAPRIIVPDGGAGLWALDTGSAVVKHGPGRAAGQEGRNTALDLAESSVSWGR